MVLAFDDLEVWFFFSVSFSASFSHSLDCIFHVQLSLYITVLLNALYIITDGCIKSIVWGNCNYFKDC